MILTFFRFSLRRCTLRNILLIDYFLVFFLKISVILMGCWSKKMKGFFFSLFLFLFFRFHWFCMLKPCVKPLSLAAFPWWDLVNLHKGNTITVFSFVSKSWLQSNILYNVIPPSSSCIATNMIARKKRDLNILGTKKFRIKFNILKKVEAAAIKHAIKTKRNEDIWLL